MKMIDLQKAQDEMLAALKERGLAGDNEAAQIYLESLRVISKDIAEWQKSKDTPPPNKLGPKPSVPYSSLKSKVPKDPDLDPFQ